jgi:FixJ family two-component response regulator
MNEHNSLTLKSERHLPQHSLGPGNDGKMQQERQSIAFVIDDDATIRDGLSSLLRSVDIAVETFASTEDFLRSKRPDVPGCLILDVRLPGTSGLDFQEDLCKRGVSMPIIFITGHADVMMGVQAMKAGAVEFLCKPFREEELLRAVRFAIKKDAIQRDKLSVLSVLQTSFDSLTPREREVMAHIVSGLMNKQIAGKLNLSEITVKVHRASIMRKMQARSLAELVRQADALGIGKPEPDA